jgi:hypothetical protein
MVPVIHTTTSLLNSAATPKDEYFANNIQTEPLPLQLSNSINQEYINSLDCNDIWTPEMDQLNGKKHAKIVNQMQKHFGVNINLSKVCKSASEDPVRPRFISP